MGVIHGSIMGDSSRIYPQERTQLQERTELQGKKASAATLDLASAMTIFLERYSICSLSTPLADIVDFAKDRLVQIQGIQSPILTKQKKKAPRHEFVIHLQT